VSFLSAFTGKTVAIAIVPPSQHRISLFGALRLAQLDPSKYHVVINDVDVHLETMREHILQGPDDIDVCIVAPAMGFMVSFFNALSGNTVAIAVVPPSQLSISLFGALKLAKLDPYMYHVVINDVDVDPEKMRTHTLQGPDDIEVRIVARELDLEVQWYISSETHFQNEAIHCAHVLPTGHVPNGNANLGLALKELLPRIPHTKLADMISGDILKVSRVRRRSLNVARHYDYERCRWVVRCVVVLQGTGILALRLGFRDFRMDDEEAVAAIMREIDTIIIA
jgi:hypothetical protein